MALNVWEGNRIARKALTSGELSVRYCLLIHGIFCTKSTSGCNYQSCDHRLVQGTEAAANEPKKINVQPEKNKSWSHDQ